MYEWWVSESGAGLHVDGRIVGVRTYRVGGSKSSICKQFPLESCTLYKLISDIGPIEFYQTTGKGLSEQSEYSLAD